MAHLLKGRRLYPEMNPGGNPPPESTNNSVSTTNTAYSNENSRFHNYADPNQGQISNSSAQRNPTRQFDPRDDKNVVRQETTYKDPGVEQYQSYVPGKQTLNTPQETEDSNSSSTDPNRSQKQNLQAKKKSGKKQQIDSDKIPRPEFLSEYSYAPKSYLTTSFSNPPPSFSNFITRDDGNAGPRFVRSSLYKIPTEESILNSTGIPLGIILQPFADCTQDEEAVPIVDYGELGPFRCSRCRVYINPSWTWTHNGSNGVCNLCKMSNAVPKEYYSPLDESNQRRDKYEKSELSKGVYEFVAPSGYSSRPPVLPTLLFCIDVSSGSYLTGIFHQILSSIQSLLDYLPSPDVTEIAIATYDSALHLFRVPEDLSKEVSVITIPELDEACAPLPKQALFYNVRNEREKIDFLLSKIQKFYESNDKLMSKGIQATCFGAALNSCCNILSNEGGRVLIFASQPPINGVGKIKKRDEPSLYGTDKEKTLFVPQIDDYEKCGKFCIEKRVAVDIFCFSPDYFDLTTISQVCGLTGGNLYYYPNYNGNYDGEKVHYDIVRNLTRYCGSDAIMTIRTSQGLSFAEYMTPLGRRPVAEIEFSALDADNALAVYFKHEDKLPEDDDAHIQAAVLYTNPYGQRVIRVVNFRVNTSKDLVNIFRSADVEATAQLIIKRFIFQINSIPIKNIRESMNTKLVDILFNYRVHCATSSSPAQLILPESLKTIPIYFNGLYKSSILRLGAVKPDERSYDLFRFSKLALNILSTIWYPKLHSLHNIYELEQYGPGSILEENQRVVVGSSLATSDDKIDDNGIYLLDNGETIYIYVKKNADLAYIQNLLGIEAYEQISALTSFPSLENDYNMRVNNIIEQLRKFKNGSYQNIRIVTEKDPIEPHFLNLLMEDERLGESYSTYLCNLHKMIQNKYNQ